MPEHIASAHWFSEKVHVVTSDALSEHYMDVGIVTLVESPTSKLTDWIIEQMRQLMATTPLGRSE